MNPVQIATAVMAKSSSNQLQGGQARRPAPVLPRRPRPRRPRDTIGRVYVIDLQLDKFDRLAARFRARQARGASLLKPASHPQRRLQRMIEELKHVASRSRDPACSPARPAPARPLSASASHELKRIRQHLAGVNCATLRGDLAMSVLFGLAKGAFTGAADARPGVPRKPTAASYSSTIGELGLDEQAMLFTAIEESRETSAARS